MSTISFIGIVAIGAGGYYLYENKDRIIDDVKEQITKAAVAGVSESLPGMMGGDSAVEVPAEPSIPSF